MRLSLGEISRALNTEIIYINNSPNDGVSCVEIDSRRVTDGGVFIASEGERVDGHRFINDVYKNGASLVIAKKTPSEVEKEHGIEASSWGSYAIVDEPFDALRKIAEYYREKLTIPVVGITGSVGKTSTKEFIAAVLSEKYNVLKTEGNNNNNIGVPLTLLKIRKEHTAAVVEMGISEFGEMRVLSRLVKPDVCVITNIGSCHLENLVDRDGVLKEKSDIFSYMNPFGSVVLNGDDDKLMRIQRINGRRPFFYSVRERWLMSVYAHEIRSLGFEGTEALMNIMGQECPIKIHTPGVHMLGNAMAAAAVGYILDMKPIEIAEGLRNARTISGRNNMIKKDKITLIDDCYNANPASMRSALDLLSMAANTKVAILGDMFELGENAGALHEEIGAYAGDRADILICIGTLAKKIYEAAREKVPQTYYYENKDALFEALSESRETYVPDNSTVLIKASHGMDFRKILEFLNEKI